jgi:hypothetical protein
MTREGAFAGMTNGEGAQCVESGSQSRAKGQAGAGIGIEVAGEVFGSDAGVMGEDQAREPVAVRQGQPQPELHEMVLIDAGGADDALGRAIGRDDVLIHRTPVGLLVACVDLVEIKARDLAVINLAQPGSRQAHFPAAARAFEQADVGKKPGKMRRAYVAARRHGAAGSKLGPIVIKLPLLRNNQLGPKGHI